MYYPGITHCIWVPFFAEWRLQCAESPTVQRPVPPRAHLAAWRWPCRSSSSSCARRATFADMERGHTAAAVAQTAPSPRHMPTRQVAHAGRRRPACALLPLRHRLRGSDAASRPRGRRGRGTADTSAPPFARGVGRPRWCARRAAAAMACVLGALEPRGHAALRRLAARLLRS